MIDTNKLIARALNIVGVSDSITESPEQEDAAKGIQALNDVLSSLGSNSNMIPYYKHIDFDVFAGKDTYTFGVSDDNDIILNSKIVELSNYAHLTRGTIEYNVRVMPYQKYLSVSRVTSVSTIPNLMLILEMNESLSIRFYHVPNTNYKGTIRVKQAFEKVELNTQLNVPPEMETYLIYATAFELCNYYGKTFNNNQAQRFKELRGQYQKLCQVDVAGINANMYDGNLFGIDILTSGIGWYR